MTPPAPGEAPRFVFIGGGARSGKSRFALQLARARGERRVFIATAQALDAEMHERIAAHQRTRGDDFRTLEEPLALPAVLDRLANECDVVVIDCLTLWLSNLLLHGETASQIEQHVGALVGALERRAFAAVVVSNEVGLGLVPETALGRSFRDLSGLAHQRLARIADDVYWALLGSVLRVRPEPIALAPAGAAP
jgi:adenosylcobinamide kinase/adenosylcobinamide-phosphate guanylyltransferase